MPLQPLAEGSVVELQVVPAAGNQANIDLYRHLIAESERNPKRDEDRHKILLTLLAEEIAKDKIAAE
jgi:hypothetical protein